MPGGPVGFGAPGGGIFHPRSDAVDRTIAPVTYVLQLAGGIGGDYFAAVLGGAPSAYFRLGEAAGTAAVDAVGGASGTYSGTVTLAQAGALSADPDTAPLFGGGQVDVADRAELDLGDGPWSIELWIKRGSTGTTGYVLNKGTGAYGLFFSADQLWLEKVNTQNNVHSGPGTVDTAWHHWVASRTGGVTTLYMDGVDVTVLANTPTFVDTADPLQFGKEPSSSAFLGQIDEVALYKRALTGAEVLAHYQGATRVALSGTTSNTYVPGVTVYQQAVSGAIVPAAAIAKQGNVVKAGSVTPAGAVSKQGQKPQAGAVTLAAVVVQRAVKVLTAAITPSGSLVKRVNAPRVGSVTPAGALSKLVQRALAAAVTPAGAVPRGTSKVLAGAVTPAASLATSKLAKLLLAGSVTPVANVVRLAQKRVSGAITPTAAGVSQVRKFLAGAVTPTGVPAKRANKPLVAAATPTGSLTPARRLVTFLTGATTPTASIAKQAQKPLAGAVTPTGSVVRRANKALAGSVTPAGAMGRTVYRRLAGAVTPSGSVATRISRTMTGSVTPSGAIAKLVAKPAAGGATPTGSIARLAEKVPRRGDHTVGRADAHATTRHLPDRRDNAGGRDRAPGEQGPRGVSDADGRREQGRDLPGWRREHPGGCGAGYGDQAPGGESGPDGCDRPARVEDAGRRGGAGRRPGEARVQAAGGFDLAAGIGRQAGAASARWSCQPCRHRAAGDRPPAVGIRDPHRRPRAHTTSRPAAGGIDLVHRLLREAGCARPRRGRCSDRRRRPASAEASGGIGGALLATSRRPRLAFSSSAGRSRRSLSSPGRPCATWSRPRRRRAPRS
jgi:hypothetical protein